ncbi:hypothetical protein [Secundilactobacillus paracollinoides]|uniref:hypothetical protein n=2 Tax=Secundilactobacillus paracollinoides TaxID=240427 RepID=UPI0006F03255|nr:hypothetical protein [Secundilactobacillus paracollinoides]KRL81022.1 hypothetical protein FC17_GL002838 [Secundilactobacillus paracollinoides DSM 15502 = JCM 11969]
MLTTDKFIRSYTPFFEANAVPFQFAQVLKNSLVVLDEFDSTKERLLEKSIDDALKVKVDLLNLFKAIYRNLHKIADLPSELQEIMTEEQSVEFNRLETRSDTLLSRFGLNYLYKTLDRNETENFLIHAPQRTLISSGKNWHSHFNEQTNSVDLGVEMKDDLKFQPMLYQVVSFIRQFTKFVIYCGRKYQNKRAQNADYHQDSINLREACYSIYDAWTFEPNQINVLLSLGLDGKPNHQHNNKKSIPKSEHRFQDYGLSLFSFTNAERHDLRTDINASFFAITPEHYLLDILDKVNVLGLSATADVPSVLDNYDLGYLHEKLGKSFMDGRQYLTEATQAEFNYDARYTENGIEVVAQVVSRVLHFKEMLKKFISDQEIKQHESLIEQLENELQKVVNKIKVADDRDTFKQQNYFKERYFNLFSSFIAFLTDQNLTSFLGLQTLLPKHNNPTMSFEFVTQTFTALCEILAIPEPKRPQLMIIAKFKKQDAISEEVESALELPSQSETRVYLLSAYKALGIGQNLQHRLGDFEKNRVRSIRISDSDFKDSRNETVDLAGMYLG